VTKLERVERTLVCEPTDRVPVVDKIRNDAALRYYTGEPVRIATGFATVCRAMDRLLDLFINIRLPERARRWLGEDGRERQTYRWTTWVVERKFESMRSLVAELEAEIGRLRAWRPDAAYVAAYREEFLRPFAYMRSDDPPVRTFGSLGTLNELHSLCGLEQFCYLNADHPDLVAAWLDARTEMAVAHVHAIAPLGLSPVAHHAEDIAFKTATLFSPAMLRAMLFPRLKRIVDAWHAYAIKVQFHSDGYLLDILDDLLACGFDGLHPIEPIAGMDPGELRRRVGRRMFLCGGIDVSQLLPFGTVAEVRAACERAIAEAAPGYFIGSSTEMHAEVPLRNVRVVYETPFRLAGLAAPGPGLRVSARR